MSVQPPRQEIDTALTVSEAVKERYQIRHRAGEAVLHVRSVAGPGYDCACTLPGTPPCSCPPVLHAALGLQSGCAAASEEGRARRSRRAAAAVRAQSRACCGAGQHGPLPGSHRAAGARGGS